jgi:beta-glucosidase
MSEVAGGPAYLDPSAPLEARARDLLSRLTLDEKVSLMAGAAAFTLEGVERLGVPRVRMADGPTGVRSNEGEPATVFPVGVAMAATWNPDLTREVAAAIGREALALGARVILAPTINIVRTPLWGRNFETYSEDPFLAGVLGAAYVEGLQGEGVGASLKHYAANNQEVGRMSVSVEMDERTLREIYLVAFEHVVKSANPWTVMASYNKVAGVYATENRRLLVDILKDEWGYDGVVVSDWGAVHATAAAANGGTDLEMPGPARWFGEKLVKAVRGGAVPERQIDDAALRLCRLILRTGVLDGGPPPKGEIRTARHRQIAERAAAEAVVLLRNQGDLLPLEPRSLARLAVVGPNADARRIQGGGSSQVRSCRRSASGWPAAPRCCTRTAATTNPSRRRRARRCSVRTRRAGRRGCCASISPRRIWPASRSSRGRSERWASWSATASAARSRRPTPPSAGRAGSGPSATGGTSSRCADQARCASGWTARR